MDTGRQHAEHACENEDEQGVTHVQRNIYGPQRDPSSYDLRGEDQHEQEEHLPAVTGTHQHTHALDDRMLGVSLPRDNRNQQQAARAAEQQDRNPPLQRDLEGGEDDQRPGENTPRSRQ